VVSKFEKVYVYLKMKVNLKSLSSKLTVIEIAESDVVGDIQQKLTSTGQLTEDSVVKLIFRGVILDPGKKISDYPEIKDDVTIVYMQSRKKVVVPASTSSAAATGPAVPVVPAQLAPPAVAPPPAVPPPPPAAPAPAPPPAIPPLPAYFAGVEISSLRDAVMGIALNQLMTNPQRLLQLIRTNAQINQLRENDPLQFDAIITHPNFIVGMLQGAGLAGDGGGSGGDYGLGDPDGMMLSGDEPLPPFATDTIRAATPGVPTGHQITITTEEKKWLEEVSQMAPTITLSEIIQIYVACGRNRDETVNTLLSIQYSDN